MREDLTYMNFDVNIDSIRDILKQSNYTHEINVHLIDYDCILSATDILIQHPNDFELELN